MRYWVIHRLPGLDTELEGLSEKLAWLRRNPAARYYFNKEIPAARKARAFAEDSSDFEQWSHRRDEWVAADHEWRYAMRETTRAVATYLVVTLEKQPGVGFKAKNLRGAERNSYIRSVRGDMAHEAHRIVFREAKIEDLPVYHGPLAPDGLRQNSPKAELAAA